MKNCKIIFVLIVFCITSLFSEFTLITFAKSESWTDKGNYNVSWYDENEISFNISTAEELAGLSVLVQAGNNFAGKTINLTNNVNLDGKQWIPIGQASKAFKGTFNGNNLKIEKMYCNQNVNTGLFGRIENAILTNIVVIDAEAVGKRNVGLVDGYSLNSSITYCFSKGKISCDLSNAGGIAGYCFGNVGTNTVSNCISYSEINCKDACGGIVGFNEATNSAKGEVKNCCSFSTVIGSTCGGIVGKNNAGYLSSFTVSDSYFFCSDDIVPLVNETSENVKNNIRFSDINQIQDKDMTDRINMYSKYFDFNYGNSQSQSLSSESPQTESQQTEPSQTEPSQTESPQTEPPQTELPQTEPPQTELSQTESPQTESPQTELSQTELPQTEPPQTEPRQAKPLQTQQSTTITSVTTIITSISTQTTTRITTSVTTQENSEYQDILNDIDNEKDVTIESKDGVLPKEIISAISGKDVDITLDIGYGMKWQINGQSVSENNLNTDINLGVEVMEFNDDLSSQSINSRDYLSFNKLIINHNGTFPFKASLIVPVGKNYKGNEIELYYINEKTGKYELTFKATVDEQGYANFYFYHASSYILALKRSLKDISAGESMKEKLTKLN